MHPWGQTGAQARQPGQRPLPQIPDPAPEGRRHPGHGVLPFDAGHGHNALGPEPVTEALAPGGEEVYPRPVRIHQVNGTGHRPAFLIRGGRDHRVDLPLRIAQHLFRRHNTHLHLSPVYLHLPPA